MVRPILAFLALMGFGGQAQAEIGPWEKLEWGITKQEVLERYPNFETWIGRPVFSVWNPDFTTPTEWFGLSQYPLSSCTFEVHLHFERTRLQSVSLHQVITNLQYPDCSNDLRGMAIRAFGKPTATDVAADRTSYTWEGVPTTIRLWSEALGTSYQSGIAYWDRTAWDRIFPAK